ncbi:MAG: hypothetical protein ACI4MS_02260 [Candidatus Coproplasma sp.]
MKIKRLLTTSLWALICAVILTLLPLSNAFAVENENVQTTEYPLSFERSLTFDNGITDYAVFGDTYAFAYNGQLAVLSKSAGGEVLCDIHNKSYINYLNFLDDGKLYVIFADDTYCVYPDFDTKYPNGSEKVQTPANMLILDDEYYFLDKNSKALSYIYDGEMQTVNIEGQSVTEFSLLKKYNGKAYAVSDNNLYSLDKAEAQKITPTYFDYEATAYIYRGDSAQKLKAGNYTIKTCWIERDSYYTEIDLDLSVGDYFALPDSSKPEEYTFSAKDRLCCIVLAESGNSSIVTMDGKCYITLTSSLTPDSSDPPLPNKYSTPMYALEKIGVYSSPYISNATKIAELSNGSYYPVTVLGQYTDLTGTVFSKITYKAYVVTDFGTQIQTVTGFVADGLLSPYSFSNEELEKNEVGGDTFNYDTNVTTVVLVIVIVLLVIIAIMYISLASNKNSKKKNKRTSRRYRDDDDD